MNSGKAALMLVLLVLCGFTVIFSSLTNTETNGIFKINTNTEYQTLSGELLDSYNSLENTVLKINQNDSLYFNVQEGSGFSYEENKYKLGNGLFLFNLNDLSNNYLIEFGGYNLRPKSPGIFYLDTTNNKSIKIYSFDSDLDLIFYNSVTKDTVKEIKILPNMSVKFNGVLYSAAGEKLNPKIKNQLKGADFLRIQQLLNFSYKTNPLVYDGSELTLGDNLISGFYTDSSINFLKQSLNNILNEKDYFVKNNSLLKSYTISGLKYIDKYYSLFLNDDKKVYYLKNKIISDLNSLGNSKKEFDELKGDFQKNFELFKSLDPVEYTKFENILKYYYKYFSVNDKYSDTNLNISFYKIFGIYDSNNYVEIEDSSFYLNKIFSYIHNYDLASSNTKVFTYIDTLLKENSIDIELEKYKIIFDNTNKDQIYILRNLSFYLENIITENFYNNKNTVDLITYNEILKYYFIINNGLSNLNIESINSLIETNIVVTQDFFSDVISKIRKNYFKEDLDSRQLLQISDNYTGGDEMTDIYNLMKKIYNYYNLNKKYLSKKNIQKAVLYNNSNKLLEEYYLALINYNDYIIKYDKTTSSLFDTATVYQNKDNKLSLEKLRDYLGQFVGFDISTLDAEIIGNYYKINNITLNGYNVSFLLYPNSFNTITGLQGYLLDDYTSRSYELDKTQEAYDKLLESEEYSTKLDFKYFFINTFYSQEDREIVEYQVEESKSENKIVMIFKRDRLLGEKGDFYAIKDVLDIDYDDVDVVINEDSYDIIVNKATYTKMRGSSRFNLILSGNYYITDNEHYFDNLYAVATYGKEDNITTMFGGKSIKFEGKIDLLKAGDILSEKIELTNTMEEIYNTITSNLEIENLSLKITEDNKIELNFISNNKTISISSYNDEIVNFSIDGEDILNGKTVKNRFLLNYLQLIKK